MGSRNVAESVRCFLYKHEKLTVGFSNHQKVRHGTMLNSQLGSFLASFKKISQNMRWRSWRDNLVVNNTCSYIESRVCFQILLPASQ